MRKLVYTLQEYDESSHEHLYHIYSFLENLSKNAEIFLIVEKSNEYPRYNERVRVYIQKFKFPLFRALEIFIIMLIARLKGYKRFYTHYSYYGGISSGIITKFLGGKSFYWSCGRMKDFSITNIGNLKDLKKKLVSELPLELTLKLVTYLVTGTLTMREYYSENYKLPNEKVRVMPNWIDLRRFNDLLSKNELREIFELPKDKKIVLFLHKLAERKGAHYIVPIAQRVIRDLGEGVFFLVAGDGPYRTELSNEINNAGFNNYIRLLGWVPNQVAVKYFKLSDLYIMPSEEEGFPRVLLEAMASECPFVATDVGGVKDILTDFQKKFLVPKRNHDAFAEMVVMLIKNESLKEKLILEGLEKVKNYSQEIVLRNFVDLVVSP